MTILLKGLSMFFFKPQIEEGQARFTRVPTMKIYLFFWLTIHHFREWFLYQSDLKILENGVRYVPKGISSRATSQVSISQLAISQMCNFPIGNFPKVRLGPLRHHRLQEGLITAARMGQGSCVAARTGWGRGLQLRQTWQVVAREIAHLGSCHLGKYPWEVAAQEST